MSGKTKLKGHFYILKVSQNVHKNPLFSILKSLSPIASIECEESKSIIMVCLNNYPLCTNMLFIIQ